MSFTCTWALRLPFWENPALQNWHLCGFLLVWRPRTCIWRAPFWLNDLLQTVHLNGLSPRILERCIFINWKIIMVVIPYSIRVGREGEIWPVHKAKHLYHSGWQEILYVNLQFIVQTFFFDQFQFHSNTINYTVKQRRF